MTKKTVPVTNLSSQTTSEYSDGDIEDRLLQHFQQRKPNDDAFIKENPGWATTYHLSKQRENLLNWIDFEPGSRVLEVGAGCGALTGVLAKKAGHVTALELSERRAMINANRHAETNNIDIVIGNLEDLANARKEKFDYVVCIGVLEYAGRFISGDKPFESFLKALRMHTKKEGALILAIENKLGLKYWSGAKEDHVGRYMEGVEDYPHFDGVKTFGKKELSELLDSAGFQKTKFYYPMPDYKLPHTIYSDEYTPGIHTKEIPSSFFPSPNPDQDRVQISREQLSIRAISKNGLFGEFANSFLVLASNTDLAQTTVFSRGNHSRNKEFKIITRIKKSGDTLRVLKEPLDPTAKGHVQSLVRINSDIEKSLKSSDLRIVKANSAGSSVVDFDYIHGISFETMLTESIIKRSINETETTIARFISLVNDFGTTEINPNTQSGFQKVFGKTKTNKELCLLPGLVDLNLDNLLLNDDKYFVLDYEWAFDFGVPLNFVTWRALYYYFKRHSQILRGVASPSFPCIELGEGLLIPLKIYEKYSELWERSSQFIEFEKSFQMHVRGGYDNFIINKNPNLIDYELPDNMADSYQSLSAQHENLKNVANKLSSDVELLSARLEEAQSSRLRKASKKAKRLGKKLLRK